MAEIQNTFDPIKSAEIIDFVSPQDNYKSLYISNIPSSLHEDEIYNILYEKFSEYGLLNGVRIFPSLLPSTSSKADEMTAKTLKQDGQAGNNGDTSERRRETSPETVSSYYAFVNFYSRWACLKARREHFGNFSINGQPCKVISSKRNKVVDTLQVLPLVKCQELANYYLGFNGWTTRIKLLKENLDEDNGTTLGDSCKKLTFCGLSEVVLRHHGIVSEGFGAWEESYSSTNILSKLVAHHKAKKISYQRSLQDAFSKIILVVLANGKVAAELNSTKPDIFWQGASRDPVLTVNELNAEPSSENIDSDLANTSENLDDINIQLLQELEDL